MVTAVSSIANGGEYMEPRVVKEIIDSETGEKQEVEVKKGDRVISEETANSVLKYDAICSRRWNRKKRTGTRIFSGR